MVQEVSAARLGMGLSDWGYKGRNIESNIDWNGKVNGALPGGDERIRQSTGIVNIIKHRAVNKWAEHTDTHTDTDSTQSIFFASLGGAPH